MEKRSRATVFHAEFREDLVWWIKTDRRVALRVLALVEDVVRDPFAGKGKPEALKHFFQGAWSRRVTQEHRLVCLVKDSEIHFLQARYHY